MAIKGIPKYYHTQFIAFASKRHNTTASKSFKLITKISASMFILSYQHAMHFVCSLGLRNDAARRQGQQPTWGATSFSSSSPAFQWPVRYNWLWTVLSTVVSFVASDQPDKINSSAQQTNWCLDKLSQIIVLEFFLLSNPEDSHLQCKTKTH